MRAALVAVLVIVVVIVLRVYLLRISEVEDEAENRHFSGLQSRSGVLQLLLLHYALTSHEHQTASHTSEHGGVVGYGQRSSIENHVIVLGEGLLDHFLHEIGSARCWR